AQYLIEKLLPMAGCIFPFRHIEADTNAQYSRAVSGIAENAIVIGAFTNIMKLSPRCLRTWAAILQRNDRAVLAFSPLRDNERPSYLRQAVAAGIDPSRIVFIAASKDEKINRARYSLVDLVLDTFPYSGGDTTLAALDMAVPVVTLCGQRHSERTTYSILMNLGVTETIAHSEAEYIDLACRLASDAVWRQSVVQHIQRGMLDSPLVDIDAHVKNLEDAYRRAFDAVPQKGSAQIQEIKPLFQEALRLHQANNFVQAADIYKQVLELEPDYAQARYLYGSLLEQTNRDQEAQAEFEAAVRISPSYIDAHHALGKLHLKHARLQDAANGFQQVLKLKPDHFSALNALGRALTGMRLFPQAIAVLEYALKVKPHASEAYFNLGVIYQKQGVTEAASAAYGRALVLNKTDVDALFNLGVICQERNQAERAVSFYQQVLAIEPDHAPAYFHMGDVLFAAGKINAWLANFEQFRSNTEFSPMLAIYGVQACTYLGEIAQQQVYLAQLLNQSTSFPDDSNDHDRLEELLYLSLFFDVPSSQLLVLYQRYNQLMEAAFPVTLALPPRAENSKIRIGYLSADLNDHVMGKMMYQTISRHDKQEFEVICYSLSQRQDVWTERYRSVSNKFTSLAGFDAESAAQKIAEDNLDILVDLSTHTQGAMPAILALKPARLQITHVASAGAVGLKRVDFKLTDHFAESAGSQGELLEQLLPMVGCVFPYRHIAPALRHNYQRSNFGIASDAVVLGAFVTLLKLSPRCLDLWRKILEAVPRAILAFSPQHDEAKSAYLALSRTAGIPQNRIVFIPCGKDEAQNQARYHLVDMVLDTLPYGGVNGTLEALDMGVPVVTLVGQRHGERTGYSIMSNLGVTKTIAHSEQEYIALATRLANDRTFHTSVVTDIRRGLVNSPLVDAAVHTVNLENAYKQALREKGVIGNGVLTP
ncbi:MAG: tetratricopeptide repeat protein, partial [Pseudomonadota bacterium]